MNDLSLTQGGGGPSTLMSPGAATGGDRHPYNKVFFKEGYVKRFTLLFPLGLYQSNNDGTGFFYKMSKDLRALVGQASSLRYQFIGMSRTTNARMELPMYESPWEDVAADEVAPGTSPFHTSGNMDTLRSVPTQVSGPFGTNVQMVLKCSASAGGGPESWQGLVAATLFFEE